MHRLLYNFISSQQVEPFILFVNYDPAHIQLPYLEYAVRMKLKDVPFPREYGSWGILITACVIGVFIQQDPSWTDLVFVAGICLVFMTKASLGAFIRRRSPFSFILTFGYAATGLFLLAPVLFRMQKENVLFLSAVPLLTVIVYALSAYLHKERASVVEFFAMATLTLPVLFFSTAGSNGIDVSIAALWFLSFLYFSASIFKVKMLLFKKRFFRIANLVYLILVLAVIALFIYGNIVPWPAGAAFLPLLDNVYSTFHEHNGKRNLKRIGVFELVKGTVFACILIVAAKTTLKI